MLVLKRKPNESITIGDNIKIVVIDQRPSGVRIGIDAPRNVTIMRDELLPVKQTPLEAIEIEAMTGWSQLNRAYRNACVLANVVPQSGTHDDDRIHQYIYNQIGDIKDLISRGVILD